MDIGLNDLMRVCLVLDKVIEKRAAEGDANLDRTIGKSLTEIEVSFMAWGLNDLEELRDLRDRLFNKIPLEML